MCIIWLLILIFCSKMITDSISLITTIFSSKLNSLETRIKSLKFTLDQVANQVDVPEHPINEKLRRLLKEEKEFKLLKKRGRFWDCHC